MAPDSVLAHVEPGVMVHGMDVGRWLATQRRDWDRLTDGQRERLTALGTGTTTGRSRDVMMVRFVGGVWG
ncbi:helicase associated domain-containing protein [Streptomyces sp. NPDC058572]|uniref:helicase associated domain-containing protein n=1 Tax=Streptomyces sp. NPDC058572 TaxID=3346546 RepID=UPI003656439B